MDRNYVDLHMHSYYSDGTMSPKEILEQIKEKGVKYFSLTDHEVLEGAKEMMELVKGTDLVYIPGVEVDAVEDGINYHILAYGVEFENEEFAQFMRENAARLEEVNRTLVEKMLVDEPSLSMEEYVNYTYDRRLGGWKTLHYFVEKGITKEVGDGFGVYRRYNHTYASVPFFNVQEVCDRIHKAGAKAVLAHPGKVLKYRNLVEFEEKLRIAVTKGIDGIECYYPAHNEEMTEICLKICREHGLLITSGADCHGGFQSTEIGQLKTEISQVVLTGLLPEHVEEF